MKLLDFSIQAPQLQNPIDQQQMAAFVSQLNEILKYVADNLSAVKVQTSAPVAQGMVEVGDGRGGTISELIIKHHATAGSRTISYKYQGTVYTITSA